MPAKETKTRAELINLLMQELRKHPECAHVVNVAITRPAQRAPHHPNWDATWTVYRNQVVCPAAFRIASELQAQFNLA